MTQISKSFDWNQARAFLATAEEGSLSAAARLLGQRQPTLSRQVANLEQDLGVMLFERVGRRLVLTEPGVELLEHFKTMGAAADLVSLVASGQSQTVEGKVSITATDVLATHLLPQVLRRIRDVAPSINISVITSNEVRDLMRREADISIRHARPEQPDLVGKKIGEVSAHLYASSRYLQSYGYPETVADVSGAEFIGFENPEHLLSALAARGLSLTDRNFKLSTNSGPAYLAMVGEGLGIGLLSKEIAATMSELTPVLPEINPIAIPVWLVTHRELHTSRRIRLVFDLLAESLL
ncbi:LysR family transcriptional regulator [Pseudohalocynthiibacter aestuariivivens]|uniref:LysR family transcriptional regulator n=1 Tax=Pseudohalocynthiibacter aestuariivivens TaxID=1591409 RepID=A0ABV5JGY4_9RHOB|nr:MULTISPECIES: LysR family transcriptional regulator [Pseudohalocynthiibacter]MBS9718196.1 LysR family transcriptional regulator [Pseudohalocynthiibacter aestuariivivens]MCK0103845.1 LysR family transcriptional regulator [Pseudohalocynthiibacter sp. F2068]